MDAGINFHNHAHRPIFNYAFLNRWFGRIWTFSSGWPAYLWRHTHVVVHHPNCCIPRTTGPFRCAMRTAGPRTCSSTWCALAVALRKHLWTEPIWARNAPQHGHQRVCDLLALWSIPFWIDWKMALLLWVLPQWVGNCRPSGGGCGCSTRGVTGSPRPAARSLERSSAWSLPRRRSTSGITSSITRIRSCTGASCRLHQQMQRRADRLERPSRSPHGYAAATVRALSRPSRRRSARARSRRRRPRRRNRGSPVRGSAPPAFQS